MGDKMFVSSFEKFLPFDEFRDFTFVVDGKPFKIHRVVFAARSPAFARIFKANPKEVTLEDISVEIFEEVAKYAYTGQVQVTDHNERPLLAAAEHFGLKDIINAVQMHRNHRMDPIKKKELETLKQKYDEAHYLYIKTVERHSIKNPFSQPPNRYY